MPENPWLLICALALCWPGPVPIIIFALLSTRYQLRNPFVARHDIEV